MSPHPDDAGGSARDRPEGVTGTVESVSTRVLLNGGGRECRACESDIGTGTRYRCVTVRDGDGAVSEVPFCGDDCADTLSEQGVVSR